MVTDQKHSSDSTPSEQNAEAYTVFFRENSALKKELKYYHSQHNTLDFRKEGKKTGKRCGILKSRITEYSNKINTFWICII